MAPLAASSPFSSSPAMRVLLTTMVMATMLDGGEGKLEFSKPTTMPLSCPQHLCKYGGSVGADTIVSFSGNGHAASDRLIGSVNRTAVYSVDAGASFRVIPPAAAKSRLAQSTVGPGEPFQCGANQLCTTGNARLNTSISNTTADGDTQSEWMVGNWSDGKSLTTKSTRQAMPHPPFAFCVACTSGSRSGSLVHADMRFGSRCLSVVCVLTHALSC